MLFSKKAVFFLGVGIVLSFAFASLVGAADSGSSATYQYKFQTPLPGMGDTITIKSDFSSVTKYLANFYKFFIGLVAILATVMVAVGGLVWLTSAGNAGQVAKARGMILGALSGLALALFSYVILYWINPNIVNLKMHRSITQVGNPGEGCQWQVEECYTSDKVENSYETLIAGIQKEFFGKEATDKCGQQFKTKESSNMHCCCVDNEYYVTAGFNIAIKDCSQFGPEWKVGGEMSLNPPNEWLSSTCQEFCRANSLGGAVDYKKVEINSSEISSSKRYFACCKCQFDVGGISGITCKTNSDCQSLNKTGIKYTCWKDEDPYKCKLCTETDKNCIEDYECCSGDCDNGWWFPSYKCK